MQKLVGYFAFETSPSIWDKTERWVPC